MGVRADEDAAVGLDCERQRGEPGVGRQAAEPIAETRPLRPRGFDEEGHAPGAHVLRCTRDGSDDPMRVHAPHPSVAAVGDQESAAGQHGQPLRFVERGARRWAAITAGSPPPDAGDGGDDAASIHPADPRAVLFGDEEAPVRERRYRGRAVEVGARGQPAVTAGASSTRARNARDDSVRVHHAHAVVLHVGDQESAAGQHGHADRGEKTGARGRPAVTERATRRQRRKDRSRRTGARDRADRALRTHQSHAMVARVRDQKSAARQHGQPLRVQVGAGGRPTVAQRFLVAERAVSGHGRDDPVRIDPPDHPTAHQEAAVGQRHDIAGFPAGVGRGATVTAELRSARAGHREHARGRGGRRGSGARQKHKHGGERDRETPHAITVRVWS